MQWSKLWCTCDYAGVVKVSSVTHKLGKTKYLDGIVSSTYNDGFDYRCDQSKKPGRFKGLVIDYEEQKGFIGIDCLTNVPSSS